MEDEHDEYCPTFRIEERRRGGLEEFLCVLRSHLVDHTSLVDSDRGFLCQDIDRDLDI